MSLTEDDVLGRITGVSRLRLETWVARGWLNPGRAGGRFEYTEIDVARCDLLRQLRDELEIDREALPVVLSLLDQVHGLRRDMRALMKAIEYQPENVKSEILKAVGRPDEAAEDQNS